MPPDTSPAIEGESFLHRFRAAQAEQRDALRAEGRQLAERVRRAAINLSYSKATEFSPEIPKLFLLTAMIAVVAYGADSPELEPYEREVYYYKNFDPNEPMVAEYERFRRDA